MARDKTGAAARAARQDPSPESAPSHHHDELIPAAAAARLFGVHVSTWRRYVQSGVEIPEPVVLGVRGSGTTAQKFLWWKSEVLDARERLPRASETDSSWRRRGKDKRHERAGQ